MIDIDKRRILRYLGAGAALSMLGETTAGATDAPATVPRTCPQPNCIHPELGYTVIDDERLPAPMRPDHQIQLLVGPKTRTVGPPQPPLDFFFDPVGLAVDVGDVVAFVGTTPEHSVTAYHAEQERQQRLPTNVPPFSSPLLAHGRTWLYRFTEPGVYDYFCGPHESFAMAGRIVVGGQTAPIVRQPGRPPLDPSLAVLDDPALAPANVVSEGSVAWADLGVTA